MRIMDIDAERLRTHAAISDHAYEQAIIHIEAEIKGDIPPLMETLVPDGPYGYTIMPEAHPDGTIKLPVLSTREEILVAYKMIRGMSDLVFVDGLTEIRGDWYLFQDNISAGRMKETGEEGEHQTLGLFPSCDGVGITGELVWIRTPPTTIGVGDEHPVWNEPEPKRRQHVLKQFDRYRQALLTNDVEAVLDTLNDNVATAVRNRVDDTGALTEMYGKDAHREYYAAFFEKYEVVTIQVLHRACEEWYGFEDHRVTVKPRGGQGTLGYHTAEFHIPGKDGRFAARIGHGTDVE